MPRKVHIQPPRFNSKSYGMLIPSPTHHNANPFEIQDWHHEEAENPEMSLISNPTLALHPRQHNANTEVKKNSPNAEGKHPQLSSIANPTEPALHPTHYANTQVEMHNSPMEEGHNHQSSSMSNPMLVPVLPFLHQTQHNEEIQDSQTEEGRNTKRDINARYYAKKKNK